jgi:hypothetical protein
MGIKVKNVSKKSGKSGISIAMFIIAAFVAVIGVALLVNNIVLYKNTVSQALGEGYDIATVRKALITSQLLPGILEPIGTYGGIAFVLLGIGIVNKKVLKSITLLTKVEDTTEESIDESYAESGLEDNVMNVETAEIVETVETVEVDKNIKMD